MKKHTLLFIGFLFFSIITFSQNHTGRVTYGERMTHSIIDTSLIKNDQTKLIITQQINATKKVLADDIDIYALEFNKNESLFCPIPIMENDANPILSRVISRGCYYNELAETQILRELDALGQKHIITYPKKANDWKITKNVKTILGYICYKAVTKIKAPNNKNFIVEAWFTNDIPYSYGPKKYSGLPGLILGLQEKGRYFYARSIDLTPSKIDISKPKGKNVISNEDFQNMMKNAFRN